MKPFSLPAYEGSSRLSRVVWTIAAQAIERLAGLGELNRLYAALSEAGRTRFVETALRALEITIDVEWAARGAFPATGPLLVVANHPSGALDGLALAAALDRVRPDVKLLGNHLLARIPEMRERTIAVDPFSHDRRTTTAGLRAARRWLAQGGALVVFPAGEVSRVAAAAGALVDRPWRRGVLRLAGWTGAAIVPAYLEGGTSLLFRLASAIDARLGTALLPRELLARRGTRTSISIGAPIPHDRLLRLQSDEARLAYLRARTYGLAPERTDRGRLTGRVRRRASVDVAPPEEAGALAREIAALPADTRLLTSGAYEVYCAAASRMPLLLREIGRLRELAFRQVGEGTGRDRDSDRFDRDYLHLFVWHAARREVVGAYRLGLTDRLVPRLGPGALYTRTLFRFGRRLLDEIGPAIELGRSFVRLEYQRDSNGLLLLWKGIGRFVSLNPRYRRLFGPVSISAEYQSLTRQLLARFLSEHVSVDLARFVRPRRPLRPEMDASLLVRTRAVTRLDEVETLVREVESGRGLPVLLRQYLKLDARLLAFSVDPDFGNVLDGLMLVDLLDVKPSLLQRYLGADGAARFLAYHRGVQPPAPVAAPGFADEAVTAGVA